MPEFIIYVDNLDFYVDNQNYYCDGSMVTTDVEYTETTHDEVEY